MDVFLDPLLYYYERHPVEPMWIPPSAFEMPFLVFKRELCCVVFQRHQGTVTQKVHRKNVFREISF